MSIEKYLHIPYKDYGRDYDGADCWGLVRLIRHDLRGDWLPSFGEVLPDDKAAITSSALKVIDLHRLVETPSPAVGAIATIWKPNLCTHVGIVVEIENRLAVIDTTRGAGVRWRTKERFDRAFARVKYYDNDY
ncbi:MAG: hypothetical protein MZU84_03270 [Sphingobacterium sp.]|nr:hypothetical protein [Sphingobacterium sp.]